MSEFDGLESDVKLLLRALEEGPVMLILTDREGEIQYVNQGFVDLTGYSKEEVLGQTPSLLNAGWQSSDFYEDLWSTIRSGKIWSGQYCNCKKNGEIFWTEASVWPLTDDSGKITHYLSVQQEVTESVRLYQRLQTLVENTLTGYAVLGPEARIEEVNPGFLNIFERSRAKLIGSDVGTLFPDEAEFDPRAEIEGYLKEESSNFVGQQRELVARTESDDEKFVETEVHYYESDSGPRFVMVVSDVTEEVQYRRELEELNSELAETNRYLSRLSVIDPLTELPNRRRFEEKLDDEWKRCRREGEQLSMVLLDIDFFKGFNDTYGHPAGDECLRHVSSLIDNEIQRSMDLVARYGGEEFAAILPMTGLEGAEKLANRMRKAVRSAEIQNEASPVADVVTLSGGVATRRPDHAGEVDKWDVVEAADGALYRAKRAGRDMVMAESKY